MKGGEAVEVLVNPDDYVVGSIRRLIERGDVDRDEFLRGYVEAVPKTRRFRERLWLAETWAEWRQLERRRAELLIKEATHIPDNYTIAEVVAFRQFTDTQKLVAKPESGSGLISRVFSDKVKQWVRDRDLFLASICSDAGELVELWYQLTNGYKLEIAGRRFACQTKYWSKGGLRKRVITGFWRVE